MGAFASPLGAVATVAGAMMAKDSASDAAEQSAEAANPHLWWQQQYALPYLQNVLAEAGNAKSSSNVVRGDLLKELPGLMEMFKGLPDPKTLDRESQDYILPSLLRDQSIAELIDRGNNPMNYGTYQDREKLAALQMGTLTDPMSFMRGPYGKFIDEAGEEAINRSNAAKGHRQGSKNAVDLAQHGSKNMLGNMQTFISNLGTLMNNRSTQYQQDQQEAYKNATLGSDLIAELIKNMSGENKLNEDIVSNRIGTWGNMMNATNAGKSDPYFDKLVTIVQGNPGAAAQAITQNEARGSEQMLGGLSRAGNQAQQAWNDYKTQQALDNNYQRFSNTDLGLQNLSGTNSYDFVGPSNGHNVQGNTDIVWDL